MKIRIAAGMFAALLALSACASGAQESSSATGTSASSSPSASASSAATGEAGSGQVSANDASVQELTAAFEAASIPNAEKWAHEVEEYRPYPADDPDMTKLREELAKYNPGPGVVDQIVATLSL